MLNATIAVIARASQSLRATYAEMARIELSPVWNGEMRTINVSKPVLDSDGKAMRDFTADPAKYPKGKVVRESVPVEVPVSVSAQYRLATKNRRNAARRVARANARFALLSNEMDATEVKNALRKLYEATA
jgi:hypothetical protein